jgi:hypothetical protein
MASLRGDCLMNYKTLVYKYNGVPLIGLYEVKSSAGSWYLTKVKINNQEEFNKLVNVCNRYMETMNLIGFFTIEK